MKIHWIKNSYKTAHSFSDAGKYKLLKTITATVKPFHRYELGTASCATTIFFFLLMNLQAINVFGGEQKPANLQDNSNIGWSVGGIFSPPSCMYRKGIWRFSYSAGVSFLLQDKIKEHFGYYIGLEGSYFKSDYNFYYLDLDLGVKWFVCARNNSRWVWNFSIGMKEGVTYFVEQKKFFSGLSYIPYGSIELEYKLTPKFSIMIPLPSIGWGYSTRDGLLLIVGTSFGCYIKL